MGDGMSKLRKTVSDLVAAIDVLHVERGRAKVVIEGKYQEGLLLVQRQCFEQLGHAPGRDSLFSMFGGESCVICGALIDRRASKTFE